jgi:pimeloyl-ACP methyl ester carboxylesterase
MATGSIYRSDAARASIERLYDQARERLAFPTDSRTVETRFGATHVLIAGPAHGRPIVALQGGNVVNPLTLAWLAPLVDTFRIYAPDTIGQPGKSAGQRVSANDASLGEWTLDVLDGVGLTSAAFIGASYGAGVFLRLAALAPDRIDRAVLVVPAGLTEVPLRSMLSLAAGYLGYRFAGRRALVEATVRQLAGPDPDPLMVESTALAFRGTALDTEMPRLVMCDELRGLTAPVIVIAAERDPLFPPDRVLPRAREVFANLAAAETLPGCAHILSEACAAALCERILPFLAASAPRTESPGFLGNASLERL